MDRLRRRCAVRGRLRLRRHFGCPTGLDESTTVRLVLEGVGRSASVMLNGERLIHGPGPSDSTVFDVTSRLRERNELAVEDELPRNTREDDTNAPEMLRAARLEIVTA